MAKKKTTKKNDNNLAKKKTKKFAKKPKGFKRMKEAEEVSNYDIIHARHGGYEVILRTGEKMVYLTNFRNKKAAQRFVEAHEKNEVTIDPETCVPTPDFK